MAAGADILRDALNEIVLRDPGFLGRKAASLPPLAAQARRYDGFAPLAGLPPPLLEAALGDGLAVFGQGGARAEAAEAPDGLGLLFCDSAVDAFAADQGRIALRAPSRRIEPLARVLADEYEARATGAGTRYLVRKQGEQWLLLINALGIPLDVWSRLLGDTGHRYKLLVVESASSDLIAGGMSASADLDADVGRIGQVLDAEGVDGFDIVGWCSGGRIAAELAARHQERVGALVLASTTFRGSPGSDIGPAPFEADLGEILSSVAASPGGAGFFSSLLTQAGKLAQPPADDDQLFRLPALELAEALTAPMASGPALQNYCRRIASDKIHATAQALGRIRRPILAVAGRHDHVLSNAHTWATLQAHAPHSRLAVVSAAGHYVHDLQYPYFMMMLDAFTQGRPFAAARIADTL